MDVHEKYVVYELNRVMGSEKHLALQRVDLPQYNGFDTEKEAIQCLIENKKTFEDYVILKQIYIN
jgi:hypothetical protein